MKNARDKGSVATGSTRWGSTCGHLSRARDSDMLRCQTGMVERYRPVDQRYDNLPGALGAGHQSS
jgi:hypothetical protein